MKTYVAVEYKDVLNYGVIGVSENLQEVIDICRSMVPSDRYENTTQLSDGCYYHICGNDSEGNYRSFWIKIGD